MAETLRTEAEYLARMPVGVDNGVTCQDLRDALYSIVRAYVRYHSEPAAAPEHTPGAVYWMDDNLNLMTAVTGVVRQLGEEMQIPVENQTGSEIVNGTPVYISGAHGNRTTVAPASNVTTAGSHACAVATHDIGDAEQGYVTTFGVVRDLDTHDWPEGTEMFLGVDGALTPDRPTGYARVVSIGFVTYQHSTDGEILVFIQERPRHSFQVGLFEARPLASSSSWEYLECWTWTDEKFPVLTGQSNQTDWTIEAYRDSGQLKTFFRYDQDNSIHADVQMPHEWAGTDVEMHLHTIPMGNGSGTVYWGGAYFFGNADEEVPALSGWTIFNASQVIAPENLYKRYLAEIVETVAAPASPTASAILSFRLTRLGNSSALDTYKTDKDHGTAKANLCVESYDIHYQRMLAGSSEEVTGRSVFNPTDMWMTTSVAGNLLIEGFIYIQLGARSRDGNEVEFRVWDVDAGEAVSDPVAVTSSTYQVVQLGPVTMGDGPRHLRIQGRYSGGTPDEPIVGIVRLLAK